MRWGFFVALCFLCLPAHADITVTQFFANTASGHADGNRVAKFNTDGLQVDFHDSQILQWPAGTNNFYRYSEQYGCPSVLQNFGSWCGIHVWYSADLGADGGPGWKDLGLLFDPSTFQSRCGPNAFGADSGCWTFRIVRNVANSNFVAWMHDPSGTGQPAVFICTPSGSGAPVPGNANCVEQSRPTVGGSCSTGVDTVHLFVDDDASGYVVYSCSHSFTMHIDKLNSAYTNYNGSNTTTVNSLVNMEGETLFKRGSTYYVVYQPICGYCDGSPVSFTTNSTSPTSNTWSAGTQINADSCNGQHEGLDKVTIGGTDYYLWHSDQWINQSVTFANQGLAGEILVPLSFSSPPAIDTIPCATSWTITNASIAPASVGPPVVPVADQTDETSPFAIFCDTKASKQYFQTFTPGFSASTIYARFTTAQNLDACAVFTTGCAQINGNLVLELVTLDGSRNPATVLASAAITPNDVTWRLTPVIVQLSGSVTSGTEYGLRLHATNTVGCWTIAYNDNLPYASGITKFSSDGGSTWTIATGRSLRFAISQSSQIPTNIGFSR